MSGNGGLGGGSSAGSSVQAAAVTVTLSDPIVCSTSQGGPFQHIYVTITDVQMFPTATQPLQNGVDLTPNLSHSPAQVDLLGAAGAGCILATLGSSAAVPPGTYQAVQVFLAGSDQVSKLPGGTKCPTTTFGPPANCAVFADGTAVSLDSGGSGSFPFPATISGGQIALSAGAQMLNIDFDSCASMLFAYVGGYGMDPTMHATLLPSAGTITGKVLDASTQQPIAGEIIIALEQSDRNNVDRETMQTAPGPDGSFVLCPVAPGKYEVVVTAVSAAGVSYVTTVTAGVQPGDSLDNVQLQPVAGSSQAVATVKGQVTATGPSGVGGYSHLVISALQDITVSGTAKLVTIPLPTQFTSTYRAIVTTSVNYELYVPGTNPFVGVFSLSGVTMYQQNTAEPATYKVEAQSSCNPPIGLTASVNVSPGVTAFAPTISLVGCSPA